jgi:CubicO group peptidase (beta-lactamase class C family)
VSRGGEEGPGPDPVRGDDGHRVRTALSSTKGSPGVSADLLGGSIAMTIAALLVSAGIGAWTFAQGRAKRPVLPARRVVPHPVKGGEKDVTYEPKASASESMAAAGMHSLARRARILADQPPVESEAPMIVVDRFDSSRSRVAPGLLLSALAILASVPPGVGAGDPPARADRPPQQLRPGDPHAHGLTDKDLDDLRAILHEAVDSKVVPGISLLLAHRGEVIFKEAYGNLKVDQKVQMASSSKSVTATLLMILVDHGKLALDDPVEKYLPEFKEIKLNGKPPARPPTVRHVLSNMSGLPGDILTESILRRLRERAARARAEADRGKPAPGAGANDAAAAALNAKDMKEAHDEFADWRRRSLAESVRHLARQGLATEPGAEVHYCTMGFNVAARVAEVAGGRPFEDLVRDELLDPLGMKDTRYLAYGLQALRAGARLPDGESRFIMAGGGMTSTLDDFAAFYQMHANGGTYHGRRILLENSIAEMQTRQGKLEMLMAGPYGQHYGLAFFLDRLDARGRGHVITHPGFFGTNPWLDRDRELIGVLFVQSNFLRVLPTVRRLQETLRADLPVGKGP